MDQNAFQEYIDNIKKLSREKKKLDLISEKEEKNKELERLRNEENDQISRQMSNFNLVLKRHQETLMYLPRLNEEAAELSKPKNNLDYNNLAREVGNNLELIREWLDEFIINKLDRNKLARPIIKKHLESISLLGYFNPTQKLNSLLVEINEFEKKTQASIDIRNEKIRLENNRIEREKNAHILNMIEQEKQLEIAQQLFRGWIKVDNKGQHLSADKKRWSGLIDSKNRLMWAVNDYSFSVFPNLMNVEYDLYEENSYLLKHIENLNRQGWCSFQDWRLPSIDELRSIAFKTSNLKFDKHKYQCFFNEDFAFENFWSSTVAKSTGHKKQYILLFNAGLTSQVFTTNRLCIRLVRDI